MNIEQITVGIKDSHGLDMSDEAAITLLRHALSKLAEQAIEPTGYWYSDDPEVCAYPGSGYFPGEVPPNDAINIIPLFTEASLAAAQQKAAEACAKVCNKFSYDNYQEPEDMDERDWADMCADAIRNGDWREYL